MLDHVPRAVPSVCWYAAGWRFLTSGTSPEGVHHSHCKRFVCLKAQKLRVNRITPLQQKARLPLLPELQQEADLAATMHPPNAEWEQVLPLMTQLSGIQDLSGGDHVEAAATRAWPWPSQDGRVLAAVVTNSRVMHCYVVVHLCCLTTSCLGVYGYAPMIANRPDLGGPTADFGQQKTPWHTLV